MEIVFLDNRMEEVGRFNNFDSLVWNERFQTPGDFQMTSYGILETTAAFPLGVLVGCSTSDFVMQVTGVDTDVDNQGNETVTVTGKTVESILAYRPALQKIKSISSLDSEIPDGWEFGQPKNNPDEDPLHIMQTVMLATDHKHYGREELKYLQLPFTYYQYEEDNGIGVVSKSVKMPHYSIDRAATVQDVFDELLPEAEMGVATLRPNLNSAMGESHTRSLNREETDRHIMFVYYRPRVIVDHNQITFDHKMEDYTSESVSQNINFANVLIQADLGHVLMAKDGASSATGLGARVKFKELETTLFDTNYELESVEWGIGFDVFDGFSQSNTFSLETTGNFPFSDKIYKFGDRSPNAYFLGDGVTLNLKGVEGVSVQIVEYIRTMDANGYREYPVFQLLRKIDHIHNDTILNYRRLIRKFKWN